MFFLFVFLSPFAIITSFLLHLDLWPLECEGKIKKCNLIFNKKRKILFFFYTVTILHIQLCMQYIQIFAYNLWTQFLSEYCWCTQFMYKTSSMLYTFHLLYMKNMKKTWACKETHMYKYAKTICTERTCNTYISLYIGGWSCTTV